MSRLPRPKIASPALVVTVTNSNPSERPVNEPSRHVLPLNSPAQESREVLKTTDVLSRQGLPATGVSDCSQSMPASALPRNCEWAPLLHDLEDNRGVRRQLDELRKHGGELSTLAVGRCPSKELIETAFQYGTRAIIVLKRSQDPERSIETLRFGFWSLSPTRVLCLERRLSRWLGGHGLTGWLRRLSSSAEVGHLWIQMQPHPTAGTLRRLERIAGTISEIASKSGVPVLSLSELVARFEARPRVRRACSVLRSRAA